VTTTDPLRQSLTEQLTRMRGGDSLPGALIDLAGETVTVGGESFTIVAPRDWEELRHQEGAEARSIPYWARVWPSGMGLADVLATRDLEGKRVLELGCGLGIAAVVAAKRGATILATDRSPDAVVFAAHNLALSELEGEVALVDWRDAQPLLDGAPWDLVIAADVLYTHQAVGALLRLLPKLIDRQGEALIADPSRAGARDFLAAARGTFTIHSERDPVRERVNVHSLRRKA
jgi:predicted nicotinamide N-methyase